MTTYGDTTAWIKIEQWSQSNIRILTIAFDVFLATVSSSKLADLYSSFGWTHFLLQAWAITQFKDLQDVKAIHEKIVFYNEPLETENSNYKIRTAINFSCIV